MSDKKSIDEILAPFREYVPRKHKTVDYARLQELMDLIAGGDAAKKALRLEVDDAVAGMKKEVNSLINKQNTLLRRSKIIPKKKRTTKAEPKSDGDSGDSRVKPFPTKVSTVKK